MLYRSLFTLFTSAALVAASSSPIDGTPALVKKSLQGDVFARNQFNPRARKETRALKANKPRGSSEFCSKTRPCHGANQYCDNGHCKTCPANTQVSTDGQSCGGCKPGYEELSYNGQSYCACANAPKLPGADTRSCSQQPVCLQGFKKVNTPSGVICACNNGSYNSLGRCTTCDPGFQKSSAGGLDICVAKTCSKSSDCPSTSPICSTISKTCSSTCKCDADCRTGELCSQGSCMPKRQLTCTTAKGTLCADGSTCTYQQTCATNKPGLKSTYAGCFTDNPGNRAIGTGTPGVDFVKADYINIDTCKDFCRAKGYKLAAVQYYNECYCGNENKGTQVPESQCYLACNTSTAELCGGDSRNSVYKLSRRQVL